MQLSESKANNATGSESQPQWLQRITFFLAFAPLRELLAGNHLPRGRTRAVWPHFLAVGGIGLAFFIFSLRRFRQSIAVTK